jgi:hypothetical protein
MEFKHRLFTIKTLNFLPLDLEDSEDDATLEEEEEEDDKQSEASDLSAEYRPTKQLEASSSDEEVEADEEEEEEEEEDLEEDNSVSNRKSKARKDQGSKRANQRPTKNCPTPRSVVKRKLYFSAQTTDTFDDADSGGTHLLRGDCTAASINVPRFDSSDESEPEASDDEDGDENGAYRLNYFVASASVSRTSNNTLKDLDMSLLAGSFFKAVSEEQEQMLLDRHTVKLFPKLFLLTRERFNVVLYGLGSKKELLDEFCERWLTDEHHFTIYGFFGELTIRHVLSSLAEPLGVSEIAEDALLDAASELDHELYIVVHSIDLLFANEPKLKRFFCQLLCVGSGNIHLIGSSDHVHSPMLFNNSENQACNWIWLDASTFQNYQLERGYQASNSKNSRGNLQCGIEWQHLTISSLLHVYNSLTPNAKQIFELILNEWLENCPNTEEKRATNRLEEPDFEGIRFSDLLKLCLENFFVNSGKFHLIIHVESYFKSNALSFANTSFETELTLRTQLTEFKDHKLIRVQKTAGVERIQVMVERKTIQKFLDKINQ